MRHREPPDFGTFRNYVGVPSEGTEPYGEVAAPAASVIPQSYPNARGYSATNHDVAVVQPDNPASIREGAPGYSQVISRHLSKNSARIDMVLAEAGVREAARLIRSARLRDMLAAIEAWDTSHGPERAYWASQGSHLIRQWRRLYPHYWEAAA